MRRAVMVLVGLVLAAANACLGTMEYSLIRPTPGSGVRYMSPAWSPDGRSIAYTARPVEDPEEPTAPQTQGRSIRLAQFKGGHWHHRLLLDDADWPVWSPDGRKLAFGRGGLCIIEMGRGHVVRPDSDRYTGDAVDRFYFYPTQWSPEGRYVAYEAQCWEWTESRIYDSVRHSHAMIPLGDCLDWSADGRYTLSAFSLGQFGHQWEAFGEGVTRVVLFDLARLKWRTIIKDHQVWSIAWPGAGRYAWVYMDTAEDYGTRMAKNPPAGPGIYRLDIRTRQLTKLVGLRGHVSFSPDYKRYAFVSTGRDGLGPFRLYIGDTNTWNYRMLSASPLNYDKWSDRNTTLAWSKNGSKLAYATAQGEIRVVIFDR